MLNARACSQYSKARSNSPRDPWQLASVASDDAYKSLDLLVDKLDGLLRRRHGLHKDKRNHPRAVELDTALPKVG